ncbi:MAG: hypothetical protein M1818_008022 [Claussenomyces sp. TS43310]|nr:MAG: hypothetical protein M1818_008022 [Claussenomyces sp. TS43310]
MGRLEALEVNALGRSPHDEDLVEPYSPSQNGVEKDGQQYDDRGHPMNLTTRQRIKDHVRASNEVMQTAGIIEETAEIRARDQAVEESLQEETEMGLRRLEIGRVVLVAGVWGVCGLRRRVLLYKSYASTDILGILRREQAHHSLLHLVSAGLPSLWGFQAVDWVGFLVRAITKGRYKEAMTKSRGRLWHVWEKWVVHRVLDFGVGYIMVHYQMFAILQQLNMISLDRWFPSNRSFIPFSAHSPLQLPPHPTSIHDLLPWGTALLHTAAPMLAILAYINARNTISSLAFGPIYRTLPRPINLKMATQGNKDSHSDNPNPAEPSNFSLQARRDSSAPGATDPDQPDPSTVHSHRQNTLESLEGRANGSSPSLFVNDEEEQTTLISLDFEATETSEPSGGGDWSAELRSAEPPKAASYRITTFTMLPPLLAAEALSTLLASTITVPLETCMVRIVARAFRASAGAGVEDLTRGWDVSWRGVFNVFVVQAAELVLTGCVWAAYTVVSQSLGANEEKWRRVREGSEAET